jgi:nucleotide-binding universal stress UspA family protein
MFKCILIPTDGSPLALKAAQAGVTFAKEAGAKVVGYYALEIVESFAFDESQLAQNLTRATIEKREREVAERILREFADEAAAAGVPFESVITEPASVYEGIIDAAKERNCDVIFLASHSHGEITALLLGSTTLKVLSHTRLPVLVYR